MSSVVATGTEKADDVDPADRLTKPLALAANLLEERSQGGAEGGGDGLLCVGAPGHHGVFVFLGSGCERIAEANELLIDGAQRARHLHGKAGVHDVLGGRAVVNAPVGAFWEVLGDLAD